jgi:hypothetical protein
MNIFEFMSNNSWLTFFIVLIIGNTIVSVVRSLTNTNTNTPHTTYEDTGN